MKHLLFSIFFLFLYACYTNSGVTITEEITEDGVKVKEVKIDSTKNWRQEKFWSKEGELLAIRTYVNDFLNGDFFKCIQMRKKRLLVLCGEFR